jgi:hypothetical protein
MKPFRYWLLALALVFISEHAEASPHGGYANYDHKSGNTYVFRLVYYKLCTSIAFPATRTATLSSRGCATSVNLTMQRVAVNQQVQRCPGATGCGLLEEVVYELEVDFSATAYSAFLGSSCCEVVFSSAYCCRPSNWSAGGNTDLYLEANLSLCATKGLKRGNSSPGRVFALPHYVIQNSTTAGSFFATDRDGDSLSYTLLPARTSAAANVSYPTGLSADKPLTVACGSDCSPAPTANPPRGFFLNPVSGDVVFYPTTANQTSMALVQIEEFRRDSSGKYHSVGKSMYEHFLSVLPAGSNLPTAFTGSQTVQVCAGDRVCFKIRSSDTKTGAQTAPDTPRLRWYTDANGASLRIVDTTLREKELEFCWSTKSADAVKGHYFLSVWASDGNCDVPAFTQRTYRIFVRNKPQTVTQHSKLPGSRLLLQASNPDTSADIRFFISGPSIPTLTRLRGDTLQLLQAGFYQVRTVTTQPGRCQFDLIDTFTLSGCVQVKIDLPGSQPLCRSSAVNLAVQTSNAAGRLSYSWRNKQGQLLGNGNRLSFMPLQDTLLRLRVDDTFGCYGLDTLNIRTYLPALVFTPPTQYLCSESDGADWSMLTNATPANAVFSSRFPNLVRMAGNRYVVPKRIATDRDTLAWVLIRITDSLSCSRADSFSVEIKQSPERTVSSDTFCEFNNRYNLNSRLNNPDPGRHTWNYACFAASAVNPANVVSGNQANISAFGSYDFVLLTQNRSNACFSRDSFRLLAVSAPVVSIKTIPTVCSNSEALDLHSLLSVQISNPQFHWQAVALDGNRNSAALATAVDAGRWFRGRNAGDWLLRFTESSTRCIRTDSIVLPVFQAPRPDLGKDTSLNIDNVFNLDAGNFATYRWDNNSVDRYRQVDLQRLGLGQHLIWVDVTDFQHGCSGRDTLRLTIQPAGTSLADLRRIGLRIGPNPFVDYLQIQGQGISEASLLAMDGRSLPNLAVAGHSGWTIQTSDLAPGHYLLLMKVEGVEYRVRVLKQQ